MKHLIKFLIIILLFPSLIQCKKNTEKDEYEIVNLILQKNVTAYGIKIFPPKKIAFGSVEHKIFNDSLVNNGRLTYYLYPNFYKLDTLKYYRSKKALDDSENFLSEKLGEIDFNKIKNFKIKRINSIPVSYTHLDVYKRQVQMYPAFHKFSNFWLIVIGCWLLD